MSFFWIFDVADRLLNLRSLQIGSHPSVLEAVINIICVERPPLLEDLQISYMKDDGEIYWHLPSALLSLPNLRRLDLRCVHVTLNDLPRALTKLHLTSNIAPGYRYFDIHDLFDALINLCRLETLGIQGVLHDKSPHISLPTVNLLHLKDLTITSGQNIVSAMVTKLCAPPTLRMKLRILSTMKSSRQIAHNLLPQLRSRFHYGDGRLASSRIKAVAVNIRIGSTQMHGYDHTDISRISRYTTGIADIEDETMGILFDFGFLASKGKHRNGVGRRIFRALMPDVEVLDVRAGNDSAAPTVWWWKMALRSLVSLKVVYLSADAQTCANFCEALQSLVKCRPRDFPRLRTLYVHKYSQEHIDGEWRWTSVDNPSNSKDYDPLDIPRMNFLHLLDLARAYVEAGHSAFGMVMTGDNSDFGYWPGVERVREISSVVSSFSYLRIPS